MEFMLSPLVSVRVHRKGFGYVSLILSALSNPYVLLGISVKRPLTGQRQSDICSYILFVVIQREDSSLLDIIILVEL